MSETVNLMPVKRAVGIVLMYIAGDVNIYLYGCVTVLAAVCVMCLFVCLFDIKSEY